MSKTPEGEIASDTPAIAPIDAALVHRLVAAQFPQWSHLPVRPVARGGWDNRTFHLGEHMSVRLPSAAGYVPQVAKEHRWLPRLEPQLPLPVPTPLALGAPGEGYPWPWSVYHWLPGESALEARVSDLSAFARTLAAFLEALQRIPAEGGPPAGAHSFHRGGDLRVYDAETQAALEALRAEVEVDAARALWQAALASTWASAPVWVHGDVAAGNLLVREGRLAAVIDFGCLAVGDPACDLTVAWTLFTGESREAFRAALPLGAATLARARGWALWKALITLAEHRESDPLKADPVKAADARRVIAELVNDFAAT